MKKLHVNLFVIVILFIGTGTTGLSQDLEKIKEQKPITFSGNIGLTAMFYNVKGRTPSHDPFTWLLNGSPTITVYGIAFPFSFTVSDQERDFRQPFNKLGVSPTYKWITVHAGYRNIMFSPYTMGGHSILGAGFELKPGNFRFGFIAGRLMRAVPYTDSISQLDQSTISTPSFKRTGYSMKIGYGTATNFVDFIILKGRDDPGSIPQVSGLKITPAENMVWSLVTKQKLAKWLSFSMEFAKSAYTRDTRNGTPDSLFSNDVSGFYKTFIHTNSTTTTNGAIDGGLEMNFEKFLFNFHYKRIEPDYQSMGAYYFQSDIRNITIEPTVKIGNNKLTIGGSLGLQRDNLGKTRNYQTDRTIGSIHATWQPAQAYQADVTYSNYDLGQKKGLLDVDTINQISQTTNNIMINQSLNLVSEKVMNTFILSYNHQNLKDRNSNTASNTQFKSDVVFLTWFITFLKAGINAGLTYNYTTFNMSSADTKYSGPGLSLGKNLLKQKINVSLSWSSYKNFMNNKELNTINLTSLRCSYRIAKQQKIQLRYSLNKSNPKDNTITPYKENKGDISYVYTF